MKILIYLGHPAHYHLFKNVITELKKKGHTILITIKKKDILEELLEREGVPYFNILKEGRKDSKLGVLCGMLKRDYRLFWFCLKNKPDVLAGTSVENSHIGKLLDIPVINVNEDDHHVVPLYSKLSYPWASIVLSPDVCDNGKWEGKSIKYSGYHELAYLSPDYFQPDIEIVKSYINTKKEYFLIRFAKLTAHHDTNIRGITNKIAGRIIEMLSLRGNVYITSERELDAELEQYRININPVHMHHIMAFATMYIGDSQTMAAEAGVLGIPFIRFNDFVGRIGYLNDLEKTYKLGFGVKPVDETLLYSTIGELLALVDLKGEWQKRRLEMLKDKINVTAFFSWLIENYPESRQIVKNNSEYQKIFK